MLEGVTETMIEIYTRYSLSVLRILSIFRRLST